MTIQTPQVEKGMIFFCVCDQIIHTKDSSKQESPLLQEIIYLHACNYLKGGGEGRKLETKEELLPTEDGSGK